MIHKTLNFATPYGCMFTATNKKGHDYYYCTNGKGICTEHKKYLRETSLYGEVSKILETIPFDEELVEIMYEGAKQMYKHMTNYNSQSLDTLKNELTTLTTRESRLLDAFLDLKISEDEYKLKNTEIKNRLVYLQVDIFDLEEKLKNLSSTLEPTKKFFLDCIAKQKKFMDAIPEEKHKTLSEVLWNLSMKDNEVLSYKLKSPYDILARTPKNANIEILLSSSVSNNSTPYPISTFEGIIRIEI